MRIRVGLGVLVLLTLLGGGLWKRKYAPNDMLQLLLITSAVKATAYYEGFVSQESVVLDVEDPAGASRAELLGIVLEFADRGQSMPVERLVLAHSGDARFQMMGDDFRALGASFATGDRATLIRSIPEKLRSMTGQPAYSHLSGGWLAVMTAQLENANDCADRWMQ